jgi:cathepsin B
VYGGNGRHGKNDDPHRMIKEINAHSPHWKAGISPRFANGERMSDLLGASTNYEELQAAVESGDITVVDYDPDLGPIPDEFDSETNWPECAHIIGDIRDQSNCGCCWAFGPASAASDRFCIANAGKAAVTFSAEDVCFCSSWNGCGGGFTGTAWSHIQKGVVTGGQYNNTGPIPDLCSAYSLPHCHHHGPQGDDPYPAEGQPGCPSQRSPACPRQCDANAQAPHNDFNNDKYSYTGNTNNYRTVEAIQQAIMTGGPIATAFTVYADFENYVGGIYHHVSGSSVGGHAVRFVGWGVENGVKYWKVANSWNPYWGENGYFRIIRGTNEGNIEGQGIASADNVQWNSPH